RPDVHKAVKKQGAHRAVDDIRESIDELQTYRAQFFQLDPDHKA
ncbi:MAG: oligoribonuclease, partial [Candidatus Paceibacteria bacterium]